MSKQVYCLNLHTFYESIVLQLLHCGIYYRFYEQLSCSFQGQNNFEAYCDAQQRQINILTDQFHVKRTDQNEMVTGMKHE